MTGSLMMGQDIVLEDTALFLIANAAVSVALSGFHFFNPFIFCFQSGLQTEQVWASGTTPGTGLPSTGQLSNLTPSCYDASAPHCLSFSNMSLGFHTESHFRPSQDNFIACFSFPGRSVQALCDCLRALWTSSCWLAWRSPRRMFAPRPITCPPLSPFPVHRDSILKPDTQP